eukprot:m.34984 g.34984  ORF g.34984 m.34984 type:complete len:440 (-) comp9975_c0_seq1:1007-2326(-)
MIVLCLVLLLLTGSGRSVRANGDGSGDGSDNDGTVGVFVDLQGRVHFNSSTPEDTSKGFVVNGVDVLASISQLKSLIEVQNDTLEKQQTRIRMNELALKSAECIGREIANVSAIPLPKDVSVSSYGGFINPLVGEDGLVYAMPFSSKGGLIFDPVRGNFSSFVTRASGSLKSAVLAQNGKIYAIPSNIISSSDFGEIAVINTANGSIEYISISSRASTSNERWRVAVQWDDNTILGVPYAADKFLVIDINANTATTQGEPYMAASKWFGAVKANNGYVYCIPFDFTSVLRVTDYSNGELSSQRLHEDSSWNQQENWIGAVLAPNNGKVYGIPYKHAYVFVLDPATNAIDYSSIPKQTSVRFAGGVVDPFGRILSTPYYHINEQQMAVLAIDPFNNQTEVFEASSTWEGAWVGAVVVNNRVYGFPFYGRNAYELTFQCLD